MSNKIRKLGPITLEADQDACLYSLARHALSSVLKSAQAIPGQKVLLPSFICRDLLASLRSAGVAPVWYEIDECLKPETLPSGWPSASFVLAVNYFGFPQDLTPFYAYAARTGAIVIEDNAHGFLSQDVNGNWLGTRAPYGLFSMRKTLRMPDGAAMLMNKAVKEECAVAQLAFNGRGMNAAEIYKVQIRRVPIVGRFLLGAATHLVRWTRKLYSGNEVPKSDPESEVKFPIGPNPWSGLLEALVTIESNVESKRRRQIYDECLASAHKAGVHPIFKELPQGCVPYGFPFRGDYRGRQSMQRFANKLGFDLITWPDLPSEIIDSAPNHYRDVSLINFLS